MPARPWRGYAPKRDDVAREVAGLIERHGRTPFHALLYARPSWPSRDSVAVYAAEFAARQCTTPWRHDSYRVALLRVACAATK